jgi:hypothetical protein
MIYGSRGSRHSFTTYTNMFVYNFEIPRQARIPELFRSTYT